MTQVAVDFPAVALTVGRQFWPELQEAHKILATNNIMPARELIAASLPRIAEIIGYYHTVVDLVPLVNEFLKDTDRYVQYVEVFSLRLFGTSHFIFLLSNGRKILIFSNHYINPCFHHIETIQYNELEKFPFLNSFLRRRTSFV